MLFVVFCCCFMETKLASNISCWALFTAPYSHRPRFCVGECNFCLLFLFLSFNVSSQRCSRRFSLWTDWVTPIRPCSGKCDFVQWLIPVWIFYWPPCALMIFVTNIWVYHSTNDLIRPYQGHAHYLFIRSVSWCLHWNESHICTAAQTQIVIVTMGIILRGHRIITKFCSTVCPTSILRRPCLRRSHWFKLMSFQIWDSF